jgi:hypothetical protein
MKQLKHTSETTKILKTWACNMSEKRPETLETKHRRAAMTYLVGNCGGANSLVGACPHARHACRRLRERRRRQPR